MLFAQALWHHPNSRCLWFMQVSYLFYLWCLWKFSRSSFQLYDICAIQQFGDRLDSLLELYHLKNDIATKNHNLVTGSFFCRFQGNTMQCRIFCFVMAIREREIKVCYCSGEYKERIFFQWLHHQRLVSPITTELKLCFQTNKSFFLYSFTYLTSNPSV